jgi:thioredoxin reductase (NADPH)
MKTYDTLILGAGPAGLTSAIYAGRYNLKTLVIANTFGGTANLAGEVENWPGFVGAGKDLMRTIKMQAERFGAEFIEADIESATKEKNKFVLKSSDQEFHGKTLIIALGTEHRQLDIPGEKEFLGKGVSYCSTCDGNFFRNKKVAVIGGADSAAKAALYLATICESVTVVYRKHEMRCEPVSLQKIKDNKKIRIIYNANPIEITGEKIVKSLKIQTEDSIKNIDVDGVFIEAGATAATQVVKDLGLKMDQGYIITSKDTKTNIPGIFAAGDVTTTPMRQMITAAGEGAIAAKSAHEYLSTK